MKKVLSLVLTLALLCCSVVLAQAEDTKPVTLTMFKASSRPMNDATELTRKYMEDNLGVDIQLTQADAANFPQQLALMVSSNEMPDIVFSTYEIWSEYASQGAYADLTPYISEEKTPWLMKYVGGDWPYVTKDGQIVGVPAELKTPTGTVTFIRQDWLDKLGLEKPTTLEEYANVLRAFTFDDPDGNGKNDTYGFAGEGYLKLCQMMGAFGNASTERDNFLNEDGKTITTTAISDDYKAALKFVRDLYAEGVIDPETFTSTYEQCQAKWGRGEMGIWTAWWSHGGNAYKRFDFGTLQPDAVVDVLMPPVGEDGKAGSLFVANFNECVGISAKCTPEQIEAAVRFLEFEASPFGYRTVQYGVEDEFFNWDEENNQTTWYWGVNGNKSKSGKYEVTDMETYKLLYHEDWQAQTNTLIDDKQSKLYVSGSAARYDAPVHEDLFAMFLTDEFVEYHADLDNYFKTNMLAFIMGDKDIDAEWDNYVSEYLSMGGEEERQSQLAAYNETMGTDYTFSN